MKNSTCLRNIFLVFFGLFIFMTMINALSLKQIKPPVKVKAFNDVDGTRQKLSDVGIGEMRPWLDNGDGFTSITSYYNFGGGAFKNNLAFYIEGGATVVMSMKLVLNINQKQEKKEALQKLSQVTIRTFELLQLPLPQDLRKAIIEARPVIIDGDAFRTELKLKKSKIDTWTVEITTK